MKNLNMEMTGPLLVAEDIERTCKFYQEVLGARVKMDLGGNITFEEGFILQDRMYWAQFLKTAEEDIRGGGLDFELYFETDDIDGFLQHFATFEDIETQGALTEYPWGQRTLRFFDPDRHLVEVGQSMRSVVWGFLDQGMTPEEAARRTQHPMEFVRYAMDCREGEK